MNNATEKKLISFASVTNWSGHWADEERFYDFIFEAFKNRDNNILKDDFVKIIEDYCADSDTKDKYFNKYQDYMEFLRYAEDNDFIK